MTDMGVNSYSEIPKPFVSHILKGYMRLLETRLEKFLLSQF
jgi:hypothetical protein